MWECLESHPDQSGNDADVAVAGEDRLFPVQDVAPISPSLCSPSNCPDMSNPFLQQIAFRSRAPCDVDMDDELSRTALPQGSATPLAGLPQGSASSPALVTVTPAEVREELAALRAALDG